MVSGRELRQTRDGEKIQTIMKHLIAEEKEVNVLFAGNTTKYLSRISHLDSGKDAPPPREPHLILDKLFPEEGNQLIKSQARLTLEFPVKADLCRCQVRYLRISTSYPHFGFVVSFPRHIEVTERRREARDHYEAPDFVSVEFTLKGGSKVYSLGVKDCSLHGLGILIGNEDLDLVERIRPGDRIEGITFYAESAIIKVDGIVRHVTQIKTGEHQGSYVLGVESPEIIENCRTVTP